MLWVSCVNLFILCSTSKGKSVRSEPPPSGCCPLLHLMHAILPWITLNRVSVRVRVCVPPDCKLLEIGIDLGHLWLVAVMYW